MDSVIERIAKALERQVEQVDQQVQRNESAREANLARHHSEREADLRRINNETAEAVRQNEGLMQRMDEVMRMADEWRKLVVNMEIRLRALESPPSDPAVVANAGITTG